MKSSRRDASFLLTVCLIYWHDPWLHC